MPRIVREAEVAWEGTTSRGAGVVRGASSGAFGLPVTIASRVGDPAGKTSPEELLAAAHAACYCMGLSHELSEAGTPPERLEAEAVIDFVPGEGVKSSRITVTGRVPGVDQDAFEKAAQAAGEGCPISGALNGNVDISVDATLES